MPLQHHPCFGLGHRSQQHLLLPSEGGRRQPGWGSSNLSSAVAPWPSPDPLSLPHTIRNRIRVVCCQGKINPFCSASSTVPLSDVPSISTARKGLFPRSCYPMWIL